MIYIFCFIFHIFIFCYTYDFFDFDFVCLFFFLSFFFIFGLRPDECDVEQRCDRAFDTVYSSCEECGVWCISVSGYASVAERLSAGDRLRDVYGDPVPVIHRHDVSAGQRVSPSQCHTDTHTQTHTFIRQIIYLKTYTHLYTLPKL